MTESLHNKTILITRAAGQSSDFRRLLEAQGATVVDMPTLAILPPSTWQPLDAAIARLDQVDWLILTSANGVEAFFQRLALQSPTLTPILSSLKIAVVGKKTATVLERFGHHPDFIPPDFIADALVAHFPEPVRGQRFLFPRVESGGRELLVKELVAQGAQVHEVPAYESGCPEAIAPAALAALQSGQLSAITFASSKTVRHFVQLVHKELGETGLAQLHGVAIASIGPQTSQTCYELLQRVDLEARDYTLDGLVQALVEYFNR